MKKNVLLVINSELSLSGVPTVIMNIVRNLQSEYNFDLITISENVSGFYDEEFKKLGGEIYNLKLLRYKKHKILFFLRFFQIKRHLRNILIQKKYDIIHCNNGIESGVFLYLTKNKIETRISHAHGLYSFADRKNIFLKFYYKKCSKWIRKFSTALLACSHNSGVSLFDNNKFYNMLNPIDVDFFSQVTKKTHRDIKLLQIGYYCSNKNQMFSVHLLDKLIKSDVKASLYFVGFEYERGYLDKLKDEILSLGLSNFVSFLPKDVSKKDIFSFSDYLLLPSYSEGLPLVLLEAQSSNVMCLTSCVIPNECDFGLLKRIDLNDIDRWANFIVLQKKDSYSLNLEKIKKIDVRNYARRVSLIYEGLITDETQ